MSLPYPYPTFDLRTSFGTYVGGNQREVTVEVTFLETQVSAASLLVNGSLVSELSNGDEQRLYWNGSVTAGEAVQIKVQLLEPRSGVRYSYGYEYWVPTCHPRVMITPTIGDCTGEGTRHVQIRAEVWGDDTQNLGAELLVIGYSSTSAAGTGRIDLFWSGDLPERQTIPVEVKLFAPLGSPSTHLSLGIPACIPGPEIAVPTIWPTVILGSSVGACNDDGTRTLSVTADISGREDQAIEACLLIGDSDTANADWQSATGTLHLSGTQSIEAPNTVAVQVAFRQPELCPPQTAAISLPECDEVEVPIEWPAVVWGSSIETCDDARKRALTVTADISSQDYPVLEARLLIGDPDTSDPDWQSGSETLHLSRTVSLEAPGSVTVLVEFRQPVDCPSLTTVFHLPECDQVEVPVPVEVHVPAEQPVVLWGLDIGACEEDIARDLTVTADISSQEFPVLEARLLIGDPDTTDPAWQLGTGTLHLSRTESVAAPGSATAQVEFRQPAGCPPSTIVIALPKCDEIEAPVPVDDSLLSLPTVTFGSDYGACDENGMRDLTITADISDRENQEIEARLLIGDPDTTDPVWKRGTGSLHLSRTEPVAAPGSVTVQVEFRQPVVYPSLTPVPPSTRVITLPECAESAGDSPTPECPNVMINISQGQCNFSDPETIKRLVSIGADISGNPGEIVEADLIVNGDRADSKLGEGSIQLAWSNWLPVNRRAEYFVRVRTPKRCTRTSAQTFNVENCPALIGVEGNVPVRAVSGLKSAIKSAWSKISRTPGK